MKKNEGLSEQVYNYLLFQILSNELKPGEKIAEAKIAKEFNTSRTPIREAMRKLESQGLIQIFPKRYAQVATFSEKEIQDIGMIRISLDILSIKLVAINGSKAELLNLKSIAVQCLDAFRNNDGVQRRKLDSDFHKELCRISKNNLLFNMQEDLSLKIQFILMHNDFKSVNDEQHLYQHIQIVDSLIEGNIEHALQLDIQHLSEFYCLDIDSPIEFFLKNA